MKKIFAILVSLLFLGSFFGIASVMAPCLLPDEITVHVGDTFTVQHPCDICNGGYLELVGISGEYNEYYTYRALHSGKVTFCHSCADPNPLPDSCATVTILPKPLPMFSFMKILGLGNTD